MAVGVDEDSYKVRKKPKPRLKEIRGRIINVLLSIVAGCNTVINYFHWDPSGILGDVLLLVSICRVMRYTSPTMPVPVSSDPDHWIQHVRTRASQSFSLPNLPFRRSASASTSQNAK